MITIRRSDERGHADRGWLDSRFTFSFADYYDPRFMGFGPLRVINDDKIAPGGGFPTHPHRDMEILTYVLEGALEHKDSTGTGEVLRPGEVQHMSAGTGILHSEFNPSETEQTHLYQIWLLPAEKGIEPTYDQRYYGPDVRRGKLCPVATPDGRDNSIKIHQDATVFVSTLSGTESVTLETGPERHVWIQVARGAAAVNGQALAEGDGAAITGETMLTISGAGAGQNGEAELIVFDMV